MAESRMASGKNREKRNVVGKAKKIKNAFTGKREMTKMGGGSKGGGKKNK